MDRDEEIMRMAQEAGIGFQSFPNVAGQLRVSTTGSQSLSRIKRFAELVAAKERETCVRKPLTSAEMAAGREAIFSTGNPYCPCDAKTFRKVAEWVERHHGITEATDGKPGEVPHG